MNHLALAHINADSYHCHSEIGNLRHREVQYLAQSHTANRWFSWTLTPGHETVEPLEWPASSSDPQNQIKVKAVNRA